MFKIFLFRLVVEDYFWYFRRLEYLLSLFFSLKKHCFLKKPSDQMVFLKINWFFDHFSCFDLKKVGKFFFFKMFLSNTKIRFRLVKKKLQKKKDLKKKYITNRKQYRQQKKKWKKKISKIKKTNMRKKKKNVKQTFRLKYKSIFSSKRKKKNLLKKYDTFKKNKTNQIGRKKIQKDFLNKYDKTKKKMNLYRKNTNRMFSKDTKLHKTNIFRKKKKICFVKRIFKLNKRNYISFFFKKRYVKTNRIKKEKELFLFWINYKKKYISIISNRFKEKDFYILPRKTIFSFLLFKLEEINCLNRFYSIFVFYNDYFLIRYSSFLGFSFFSNKKRSFLFVKKRKRHFVKEEEKLNNLFWGMFFSFEQKKLFVFFFRKYWEDLFYKRRLWYDLHDFFHFGVISFNFSFYWIKKEKLNGVSVFYWSEYKELCFLYKLRSVFWFYKYYLCNQFLIEHIKSFFNKEVFFKIGGYESKKKDAFFLWDSVGVHGIVVGDHRYLLSWKKKAPLVNKSSMKNEQVNKSKEEKKEKTYEQVLQQLGISRTKSKTVVLEKIKKVNLLLKRKKKKELFYESALVEPLNYLSKVLDWSIFGLEHEYSHFYKSESDFIGDLFRFYLFKYMECIDVARLLRTSPYWSSLVAYTKVVFFLLWAGIKEKKEICLTERQLEISDSDRDLLLNSCFCGVEKSSVVKIVPKKDLEYPLDKYLSWYQEDVIFSTYNYFIVKIIKYLRKEMDSFLLLDSQIDVKGRIKNDKNARLKIGSTTVLKKKSWFFSFSDKAFDFSFNWKKRMVNLKMLKLIYSKQFLFGNRSFKKEKSRLHSVLDRQIKYIEHLKEFVFFLISHKVGYGICVKKAEFEKLFRTMRKNAILFYHNWCDNIRHFMVVLHKGESLKREKIRKLIKTNRKKLKNLLGRELNNLILNSCYDSVMFRDIRKNKLLISKLFCYFDFSKLMFNNSFFIKKSIFLDHFFFILQNVLLKKGVFFRLKQSNEIIQLKSIESFSFFDGLCEFSKKINKDINERRVLDAMHSDSQIFKIIFKKYGLGGTKMLKTNRIRKKSWLVEKKTGNKHTAMKKLSLSNISNISLVTGSIYHSSFRTNQFVLFFRRYKRRSVKPFSFFAMKEIKKEEVTYNDLILKDDYSYYNVELNSSVRRNFVIDSIDSTGFFTASSFFSFEKKKPSLERIEQNGPKIESLISILLEIGVHIGTEVNGHVKYRKGYNEWMSGYIFGFFRVKQFEFNRKTKQLFKKGRISRKDLKFPIINIQSTLSNLQRGLKGIRGIGKLGGKWFFYHPEMRKLPGFLLFLGSIANFFGHSCGYISWIPGAVSNYLYMLRYFFDRFFSSLNLKRRRIKGISFISFLFRVIYYNSFFIPSDILLEEFEKECRFWWKMLIFFRFFMDYFSVSDFAVGMNPLGISSAILEYGTQRIGSLSAVDTDSSVRGPFYGVPSNDDSFIIASFYFSMALNAFEYGRVDRYHSNFFSVTNTLNS